MKWIIALALLLPIHSYALTIEKAQVLSEADSADDMACRFSNQSAVAAVESVLRQNRIILAAPSERNSLLVYLNTGVYDTKTGACAVSPNIQFYVHDKAVFPTSKLKVAKATVVFCEKGSIGYFKAYDLQSRINEAYRDYTEQCISKIEKLDR